MFGMSKEVLDTGDLFWISKQFFWQQRPKFGLKAPPPQSPYPDGPFHNLVKSATATSCGVTLGACSCVRPITDNRGSRAASFKTPSPSIWST